MINWELLETEDQLDTIIKESQKNPVIIYKHSTMCGISSMAKSRLERNWDTIPEKMKFYFLDIINNRSVSNRVEEIFKVLHESPQIIVIRDGRAVYDNSHMGISVQALKEVLV